MRPAKGAVQCTICTCACRPMSIASEKEARHMPADNHDPSRPDPVLWYGARSTSLTAPTLKHCSRRSKCKQASPHATPVFPGRIAPQVQGRRPGPVGHACELNEALLPPRSDRVSAAGDPGWTDLLILKQMASVNGLMLHPHPRGTQTSAISWSLLVICNAQQARVTI